MVPTTHDHSFIHAEAQRRRAARLAAKAAASEQELRMRLPPVTHREGSPTLAPALQVLLTPCHRTTCQCYIRQQGA